MAKYIYDPVSDQVIHTLKLGDIVEDCKFHPCLVIEIEGDNINCQSLIDPERSGWCNMTYCDIRLLSIEEYIAWLKSGAKTTEVLPDTP